MKRLVSAFLAGAMALSLAACGGAASTSTAASASASASGSAAVSQTAGSDLDYIKGKGKLVIGYTVYEPMNYTDADGNEGFTVRVFHDSALLLILYRKSFFRFRKRTV